MEGLMFYWICWIYWIYLTFIVNKQKTFRFKLSAFILILIIFSNSHFMVGSFEINMSGCILLAASFFLMSRDSRGAIIYYFICSFIVMIAYVTFQLFEIFDPIWVVFRKEWMLTLVLSILSLLLQNSLKGRLLIIACGTMQGEVLYAYILSKYPFPYPIGTLEYLDVILMISGVLAGWSGLENAGPFFNQYFNLPGKGKQKSS